MLKVFTYVLLFSLVKTLNGQTPDTGMVYSALPEDSARFKILRLEINSAQSDFSPFMYENMLYFVSGRKKGFAVQYVDHKNNPEITDLYAAERIDTIHFKNLKAFDAPINTNYYEGPLCLNSSGNKIYYSANDKSSGKLKIYSSEKNNGKWTTPQILSFCENNTSYCHPSLSSDGSFLVFSSDINFDSSGMDLFWSRYENNQWSCPAAFHQGINSPENEAFPFLAGNTTLYFSSNKTGGKGGMDIYKVILDSSSAPLSFDYPVNSEADDFGIWVDSCGERGYFSSNRLMASGDDLYYFYSGIPDFSNSLSPPEKNSFCYTFYEENTAHLHDTIHFSFEWDYGDGHKGYGLKTRHCYTKPGKYTVQLNVIESKSGGTSLSHSSYSLLIAEPVKPVVSSPDTVFAGEYLTISSGEIKLEGFEIQKLIWSFGDGKYNYGPVAKHKYNKAGEYSIDLGILAINRQTRSAEHFRITKKICVLPKPQ